MGIQLFILPAVTVLCVISYLAINKADAVSPSADLNIIELPSDSERHDDSTADVMGQTLKIAAVRYGYTFNLKDSEQSDMVLVRSEVDPAGNEVLTIGDHGLITQARFIEDNQLVVTSDIDLAFDVGDRVISYKAKHNTRYSHVPWNNRWSPSRQSSRVFKDDDGSQEYTFTLWWKTVEQ